ncbi:MAG: short-chain dehydrogenase [Bacteroidota bacterium]|nr:short-chain dehydrogenase [Bacteroidota bacterium]
MTNDMIEKYVAPRKEGPIKIHFKQRSTITGIFIHGNDYDDLRSKNFWRIVTNASIETWKKTKDNNLAKIFSGSEFTRLSEE